MFNKIKIYGCLKIICENKTKIKTRDAKILEKKIY